MCILYIKLYQSANEAKVQQTISAVTSACNNGIVMCTQTHTILLVCSQFYASHATIGIV